MKTAKNSVITLAVMVMAITMTTGAAQAATNFSGALHFNAGFPQGELKDQIDRNAYGVGGEFFFAPQRSPLAIGLDLSWMNYGSETRREPFSTTIPDVTVDVNTSNNIVQTFLVLRGQMPGGPIRVYGDALVGFNYLYTETKITDTDSPGEAIVSSTNQDDAAFAYGFGGGVMVPILSRMDTTKGKKPFEVSLDGGLRYIFGGEAEYLKKGSIRREDGAVTFDRIQSKTDMLKMHVGVSVRF